VEAVGPGAGHVPQRLLEAPARADDAVEVDDAGDVVPGTDRSGHELRAQHLEAGVGVGVTAVARGREPHDLGAAGRQEVDGGQVVGPQVGGVPLVVEALEVRPLRQPPETVSHTVDSTTTMSGSNVSR
jgi:hypothetical protein